MIFNIKEKSFMKKQVLSKVFPEWMLYHAFYSTEKRTYPYFRLFLDYFDIRPRLVINKFKTARIAKKMRLPLIGFIHVPKTGGSYTTSSENFLPHINFSHAVIRKNLSDKFCPVGLVAIKEIKINNCYIFSIIRNPLNFLVSYYHHVKGFEKHYNKYHYDYQYVQNGFENLIRTILNRTDKWPSRKFLFPQLFDQDGNCIINWINRNEMLDTDLLEMCNKFGYKFVPGEKQRVSPKKNITDYYTAELIDLVSSVFSREMKLFGYNKFNLIDPLIKLRPFDKNKIQYNYIEDKLIYCNTEVSVTL